MTFCSCRLCFGSNLTCSDKKVPLQDITSCSVYLHPPHPPPAIIPLRPVLSIISISTRPLNYILLNPCSQLPPLRPFLSIVLSPTILASGWVGSTPRSLLIPPHFRAIPTLSPPCSLSSPLQPLLKHNPVQGQIEYRSRIENWRILRVTSPGDSGALSQYSYIWPAELRNLHFQTCILEMLP